MVQRERPCCGEAHQGGRSGGVTAPFRIRAAAAALARYLGTASSWPQGPGLRRAGRHVGRRPVPGRAGRAGRNIAGLISPLIVADHRGPGRGGRGALRRDRVPGMPGSSPGRTGVGGEVVPSPAHLPAWQRSHGRRRGAARLHRDRLPDDLATLRYGRRRRWARSVWGPPAPGTHRGDRRPAPQTT